MADIQTRFTLRANAEGFDQARRQVTGLNDAMSKVAATQQKLSDVSGKTFTGNIGGTGGGGRPRKGALGDPLAFVLGTTRGGSTDGRNTSRDSNDLLNLIKRLEAAQRHAGDVAVEGLKKETQAANDTAAALKKRNDARGGGGAGGTGGGGGGGGGDDEGDGKGGGRFGKYRKSFGLGFMQKVSGIDFLQSGAQGLAQIAGGFVGSLASQLTGSIASALKGVLSVPAHILSQGSGSITSLGQALPFSSIFGGAVQQNVDFGQQEIANQRSLMGLIPFLSRRKPIRDQGQHLIDLREDLAQPARDYGGMNANEGFSALASSVAGAGGYLDSISKRDQGTMFALNRMGISDLGTSASILRSQQLGFNKGGSGLLGGANDAFSLGLQGSEVQGYMRSIAEGLQRVVTDGISFSEKGRADLTRTLMANGNITGQRAQYLEGGFRQHVQQIARYGIHSGVDALIARAYGYKPEGGAASMAQTAFDMTDETKLSGGLQSTLEMMRRQANYTGGLPGSLQMMNMMQQAGLGVSPQEADKFRTNTLTADQMRDFMRRQTGDSRLGSAESAQAAAYYDQPPSVRKGIDQENIAFRSGVKMAPDVQDLDARQAHFTRQLTGFTEGLADFNRAVGNFMHRLTGLGGPAVTPSRPMALKSGG